MGGQVPPIQFLAGMKDAAFASPARGHIPYWNTAGKLANLGPGTPGGLLLSGGAGADPGWSSAGGVRVGIGLSPPQSAPQSALWVAQAGGGDVGALAVVDTQNTGINCILGMEFLGADYATAGRMGVIGPISSANLDFYVAGPGGITFCPGSSQQWSGVIEALDPHYAGSVDAAGHWALSNAGQGAPVAPSKLSVWGSDATIPVLTLREPSGGMNAGVAVLRLAAFDDTTLLSWQHGASGPLLNWHDPSTGTAQFSLGRTAANVLTCTAGTAVFSGATGIKVDQIQPSAAAQITLPGTLQVNQIKQGPLGIGFQIQDIVSPDNTKHAGVFIDNSQVQLGNQSGSLTVNFLQAGAIRMALRTGGDVQLQSSLALPVGSFAVSFGPDATSGIMEVDASGAARTLTLPAPSAAIAGRVYFVKKIDSSGNAVTVQSNSGGTLDGVTNGTLVLATQWKAAGFYCTSGAWRVLFPT